MSVKVIIYMYYVQYVMSKILHLKIIIEHLLDASTIVNAEDTRMNNSYRIIGSHGVYSLVGHTDNEKDDS